MASGKPSSKRKSSSSHKKKSSEVKKRKSRSRKRDKSKKIRRRDLSVSCSDDDSRTDNSSLVSSSDSDDDYRSRKGRSHSRDVKESKKRKKRSSPIGDDIIRKKLKKLKRRDSHKEKKKSRHGKSHKESDKRDVSVNSANGGSRSSSPHRDGTSSESDVESSRGRSKRREKSRRGVDKTIKAEDRYKYGSRSCSPCSGGSERSRYHNEEKLVSENYSNRLRSVLAIPNEYEEEDVGRYCGKEENEAEIIQAYDDYPSCKSNESYDGGRRKESSHQASVVPERNRQIHDRLVEDKSSRGDTVAQRGKIDQTAHLESAQTENKNGVSSVIVSSDVASLESILRQKALENFRKFRGGHQADTVSRDQKGVNGQSNSKDKPIATESSKEAGRGVVGAKDTEASVSHNQKGGDGVCVKQSSISNDETIKNVSRKEADTGVVGAKDIEVSKLENVGTTMKRIPVTYSRKHNFQNFEKDVSLNSEPSKEADSGVVGAKVIEVSKLKNVSTTAMERTPVTFAQKHNFQISDGISNQLRSHEYDNVHAGDRVLDEKPMEKKIVNLGAIRKSSRGSLVYRRESSGDTSLIKQASHTDCSDRKPQETKFIQNQVVAEPRIQNQIAAEPRKAAIESSDRHEINEVHESASEVTATVTPATEDHSSTGPGAKGGSEFEQKTMTVMRGGEMVQVSYKVYIPKKPPALARRQLKR